MRARAVAKRLINAQERPEELLVIATEEAGSEVRRIVVMRSKRSLITDESVAGGKVEFRIWFDAVKARVEQGGKNSAFLGSADTIFEAEIVKWKERGMKIGERWAFNQRPERPESSPEEQENRNGGSSDAGKPIAAKA